MRITVHRKLPGLADGNPNGPCCRTSPNQDGDAIRRRVSKFKENGIKYDVKSLEMGENTHMKSFRKYIPLLACVMILAGCGKVEGESELARTAYAAFLAGDISLFASADIDTWALDTWKDSFFYGELEYAYLDLDGDGTVELLVQCVEDPCSYNGVFHYDSGRLYCWQYDCVEGSCRDYPLRDGTMVRQYDYSGVSSYTIFRYQTDGTTEDLMSLFTRQERIPEDSAAPCPYYEVDGNEVEQAVFAEQLKHLITDQMLERPAWTAIYTH